MAVLMAPDNRKMTTVAGSTFKRGKHGAFEVPNEACFVEPLKAEGFTEFIPQPKVGEIVVPDNVKSAEFHAVVIRCGCGDPLSHAGAVCPRPRTSENLGQIAGYYRNPLRRFLWKLRQLLKEA